MNPFAGGIAENYPRAQKPYASDHALNNPASSGRIATAGMLANEHHERGPKCDDAHRPHSGGLSVHLAIQTDHTSNHGGGGQANHSVRPINHPSDILATYRKINEYAARPPPFSVIGAPSRLARPSSFQSCFLLIG